MRGESRALKYPNQITAHFKLSEVACHDGTPYPEEWIASRLIRLLHAAEWIRERCGFPLVISSGYRTPSYNRKIGGARFSQHVQGLALDLHPKGSLKTLQEAVKDCQRIEGLISGIGFYADFVHIDRRPGRPATWNGSRTNTQNTVSSAE